MLVSAAHYVSQLIFGCTVVGGILICLLIFKYILMTAAVPVCIKTQRAVVLR